MENFPNTPLEIRILKSYMHTEPQITIGNRSLGAGRPVYIVAELSANHNQNLDTALASVRAVADSGADAVKVQTYTADSMTLDIDDENFLTREDSLWAGARLYDLYREGALPLEWHKPIKECANSLGLDFFSTPFDPNEVDFLDQLEVPAFKIASLEIVDIPLIRRVASTGKAVILSTGIASEEDIQLAVDTCRAENNYQILVLQCTTQYPTEPDQVNLRSIPWIRKTFGVVSGLSDHTMGIAAAIASIPLGCSLIEKHFILDKSLSTLDDKFSLDPKEFSEMVRMLREAERMLGDEGYRYTDVRKRARRSARSLIAVKDIMQGEAFSTENVRSLRPNIGLPPQDQDKIIGHTASRNIRRGEGLSWNCVKGFLE